MKEFLFMLFYLLLNDMIFVFIYLIIYGNKLVFKKENMDLKFIEGKDFEINLYFGKVL